MWKDNASIMNNTTIANFSIWIYFSLFISKNGEYFLYGIPYTKDEWQEARSQREGLPYYKNQSMKSLLSDYRN